MNKQICAVGDGCGLGDRTLEEQESIVDFLPLNAVCIHSFKFMFVCLDYFIKLGGHELAGIRISGEIVDNIEPQVLDGK